MILYVHTIVDFKGCALLPLLLQVRNGLPGPGVAVAAILTQPDDEGFQHPVACESSKLTAAERNYPAQVLELLAVVHALQVFKHYLLASGAPRPLGCGSDFDLATDTQAITWLKTNRHIPVRCMSAGSTRWRTSASDFRFGVTHLPGARNPADPLTRRGFPDGPGPAASADPDPPASAVGWAGADGQISILGIGRLIILLGAPMSPICVSETAFSRFKRATLTGP
jgi:hypothetical protein